MHRIFTALRHWLEALLARPPAPAPLDSLGIRDYADLPPTHPLCDA